MNKIIKTFFTSLMFASIFAPAAVSASSSNDALNDLVQLGLIGPGQANSIGSRMGRGFFSGGRFSAGPRPAMYDSSMIQRGARDIDKLQRDGLISIGELNALKAQLDARVVRVNSGAAPVVPNAGPSWNHGYRGRGNWR